MYRKESGGGYNLFPNADSRKAAFKVVNRFVRAACQVVKVQSGEARIGEFTNIYKGVIWSSLPYEQVSYVLSYIDAHPEFLTDLKHTIIPEEFFF